MLNIFVEIPNFEEKDFTCRCGCGIKSNRESISKLQNLRDLCNFPFIVNSSIRCEEHNKTVGGSKNSYHLKGIAFDISKGNMDTKKQLQFVKNSINLGFTILSYKDFFHIDLRKNQIYKVQ